MGIPKLMTATLAVSAALTKPGSATFRGGNGHNPLSLLPNQLYQPENINDLYQATRQTQEVPAACEKEISKAYQGLLDNCQKTTQAISNCDKDDTEKICNQSTAEQPRCEDSNGGQVNTLRLMEAAVSTEYRNSNHTKPNKKEICETILCVEHNSKSNQSNCKESEIKYLFAEDLNICKEDGFKVTEENCTETNSKADLMNHKNAQNTTESEEESNAPLGLISFVSFVGLSIIGGSISLIKNHFFTTGSKVTGCELDSIEEIVTKE